MADTAVFDVDGTLVDTNYHHTIAWYRAFLRHETVVPLWQIHRAIGMGGDRLVGHVASEAVEAEHGDSIRAAWEDEFDTMIGEIKPFDAAHDLLRAVRLRGFKVVLASSGKRKHVEVFLELIGADELVDAWTTSDDAEQSKPHPDLVATAMEQVGGGSAVMVGDSVWDCRAAAQLDVATIAVQNGGFCPEELRDAGAVAVFASLAQLQAHLDDTALRKAESPDPSP